MHGSGPPKHVRRDVSIARRRFWNVEVGGESAHALVEAEARKRLSRCGTEHMALGIFHPVYPDEAPQDTCGLVPQRAVAPLPALSVQAHMSWTVQGELFDPQVGDLLHAGAGIVEEQQQCAVAQRKLAVAWESSEKCLDFFSRERMHRRLRAALDRNRRDLLALSQSIRVATRNELEERVKGAESLIACGNAIVPLLFEMSKKRQYPFKAEIFWREFADLTMSVGSGKLKEQTQSITVAAHRALPQALLLDEVAHEELLHPCTESGGGHGRPSRYGGAAYASKRALASSSRSLVIVRYTAVLCGLT